MACGKVRRLTDAKQIDPDFWRANPGRVLLLGFARSGGAAASLLVKHGFHVTVNDKSDRPECHSDLERLERAGVQFVFGSHPTWIAKQPWQFVVKNPGIPYAVPLVKELVSRKIPVLTEIEVASWWASVPLVAITGSNGKTTTTTLVGEMIRVANRPVAVAGNIGTALASVVEEQPVDGTIVLEVSSFQLVGTETFHPHVAALLNIQPAHLDYHGSFDAYARAKWRMFSQQTEDDIAVLNRDHPLVREGSSNLSAKVHWFSTLGADFMDGAGVVDDDVVLVQDGQSRVVLKVSDIGVKGVHNLRNFLAAAALSSASGVPDDAIAQVGMDFYGVEHRLEFVRQLAGVDFYNDSKATNPDACLQALAAFSQPVVWIAGGLDRGITFFDLVDDIRRHVRIAILLGESKHRLKEACDAAGVASVFVESVEDAVHEAHAFAKIGDVVLLSPACASWDMFTSFEVRGSMFKEAVHTL